MLKMFRTNEKYKRIIRYVIVGAMTTLVSFSSYWVFYKQLEIEPNLSNVFSIILAVIFAYITNKIFVFRNKVTSIKFLFVEFAKFLSSRGLTMVIEILGVFIALNIYNLNELLAKGIVSIVVLVLNYLLSQFFVFRHTRLFRKREKF